MSEQEATNGQSSHTRRGLSRRTKLISSGAALVTIAGGAVGIGLSQTSNTSSPELSDAPTLPVRPEAETAPTETAQTTTTVASAPPTTSTTTPNTPPTTESANQRSSEAVDLERLTHPAVGDQFSVVDQRLHLLINAPVRDRPASLENGAKPILGGFSGDITQAVVVNNQSGNYFCFYPDQTTIVACIDISDPNTTQYVGVFNNDGSLTPYNQVKNEVTSSQVTVNQVNGTPFSLGSGSPSVEVPIGGFSAVIATK